MYEIDQASLNTQSVKSTPLFVVSISVSINVHPINLTESYTQSLKEHLSNVQFLNTVFENRPVSIPSSSSQSSSSTLKIPFVKMEFVTSQSSIMILKKDTFSVSTESIEQ